MATRQQVLERIAKSAWAAGDTNPVPVTFAELHELRPEDIPPNVRLEVFDQVLEAFENGENDDDDEQWAFAREHGPMHLAP